MELKATGAESLIVVVVLWILFIFFPTNLTLEEDADEEESEGNARGRDGRRKDDEYSIYQLRSIFNTHPHKPRSYNAGSILADPLCPGPRY